MAITIGDADFGDIGVTLQKIVDQINSKNLTLLSGDGAIPPHAAAEFIITKATAAALTLAAPTSGAFSASGDDGKTINVSSNTAAAHVITATGLLLTGSASVNTATFAAQKGASLSLMAYGGKWIVRSSTGVTFA